MSTELGQCQRVMRSELGQCQAVNCVRANRDEARQQHGEQCINVAFNIGPGGHALCWTHWHAAEHGSRELEYVGSGRFGAK
jgi:hypothetical protein